MISPEMFFEKQKKNIEKNRIIAFMVTFITGILINLPALINDFPNHDGLASMYFDQNMITSGRWFLSVACGASSYFTVPWIIGLVGFFFLGLTAAFLISILDVKKDYTAVIIGALLAVFPSVASTLTYVFTFDGYMVGLFMMVLAVYLTKKQKFGFVTGAVLLACGLGTYQAYLPVAVILCMYLVVTAFIDTDKENALIVLLKNFLMGAAGAVLYEIVLKVLLLIQGKELDTYQGINDGIALKGGNGIISSIKAMYADFFGFTIKGNVLMQNAFQAVCLGVIVLAFVYVLVKMTIKKKLYRKPLFYVICVSAGVLFPLCANLILIVSPSVTYHLLMRYQWVFILSALIAFCEKYGREDRFENPLNWALLVSGAVLIFTYFVCDNIGYSNLQKKYEKTYAYCLRLLDRIEQTEGYYEGIPVSIVGVISNEQYPTTDITKKVTGNMIGLNGDFLVYKPENYSSFIKNYLGATINFVDEETVTKLYYCDEYIAMPSFPKEGSVKIIDGVLCIKTENYNR